MGRTDRSFLPPFCVMPVCENRFAAYVTLDSSSQFMFSSPIGITNVSPSVSRMRCLMGCRKPLSLSSVSPGFVTSSVSLVQSFAGRRGG